MINAGLADVFVDQLNNAAGRQIAVDHPNASESELQNLVLEAVQGSNSTLPRLYNFTNNADGKTSTVVPSSLTNEQFMQARWDMNTPPPSSGVRLFSPLP